MSPKNNNHVRIGRSVAGMGLFANRPIKRGEVIVQYSGEIISNDEANKRAGKYLMHIDRKSCIDGRPRTNLARYINHSCRPNCVYYIENGEVWAYAKRGIAEGEELTVDYGDEYVEAYIKPHGCKCADCSGT